VLLLAACGYGDWRLRQDTLTPGPRVALIQGNLDQRIRNDSSVVKEAAQTMADHFIDLSDLAARYRPDLIVWPETSCPDGWTEVEPGRPDRASQQLAEDLARRWRTEVLIGVNARVGGAGGPARTYNSAVLIDRHGRPGGRYDKIHRVPFGEYIPVREWLPGLDRFAPYDFDYAVAPGEGHTRFPLADPAGGRPFTFGVVICYEDTIPEMALPYGGGDGQPAADFLLNLSNDGWFNGSSEHDQHLAICRFRAVECRRSVARAVNMGISALIDSNGRVLGPHPLPRRSAGPDVPVWEVPGERGSARALPVSSWGEYKKVAGVLLATVPIDSRASPYARWGDWLPGACWLVLLAGCVAAAARPRGKGPGSPPGSSGV
jgi:apolipoprotein N-acyltransferase